MAALVDNSGKNFTETFRAAREILSVSPAGYGRLLEVDTGTIVRLERGELPAQPDEKLLKLILATSVLCQRNDFIAPLLDAAAVRYQLPQLHEQPQPLLRLFEPAMSMQLARYPWLAESARFRCRLLQLTDQSNGILLWAEEAAVHRALSAVLPSFATAHINLLAQRTLIFIPAIMLFLNFDTTAPTNPLPLILSERFKEGLPVGLAVAREPFASKSPAAAEVEQCERRLFIFTPDPGSICEILTR